MYSAILALAVCVLSAVAHGGMWDDAVVAGETDAPPCSYRVGQPVRFEFSLTGVPDDADISPYRLQWRRRGDDGVKGEGSLPLAHSGMTVETKIGKPGFVHLEAWIADGDGKPVRRGKKGPRSCTGGEEVRFTGGAGADIAKIVPGTPAPKDFAAKWKSALTRLRREKPVTAANAASFAKDVTGDGGFLVFEVAVPSFGPDWTPCHATGYMTIPKNASPKSLKAKVSFDGYGIYRPGRPPWCDQESIELHVNAHGFFPLAMTDAEFAAFEKDVIKRRGDGYGFNDEDNAVFERAYFFGMAMRAVSATTFLREFVRTRPEWDGRTLQTTGGSQGGLQAVWAAALTKGVTEMRIHVPWCCDLGGTDAGRMGGWRPASRPGLAYFDPVNMAPHIPASVDKVVFRSALGDYIAPPCTHAVLYNAMKGSKEIRFVQGGDHYDDPPGRLQEQTIRRSASSPRKGGVR